MAIESLLSTRAQKAFMGTILLQGIIVIVMVGIVFGFVADEVDFNVPRYKTLPCYLALFVLAEIFELLMAFDALRLRNVIQLVGILAFHGGLIVFAAIQPHETRTALVTMPGTDSFRNGDGSHSLWHKVLPFLIVPPIIIFCSWGVLLYWVRELYFEFGWAIFHIVGANPAMKTMYQFYQVLICLLKFDFFCFTGVTIQLLIVVLQKNSAEFGLTIAAIPIVLLLLAGAGFATKREIKWLMSMMLVLMLAAETYFSDSREQYETTRATLTVFTIIAFLLLFLTFALHGQSYKPVATALKENLFGASPTTQRHESYLGGTQLGQRISIE
ncbi:UPF0658 Golgi apparatus membrane protein [Abortiporus biennis]